MIDNKGNKKEKTQEKSFPKVHVNWDSGAYRKLLVTIDKSYFRKNIFCIF